MGASQGEQGRQYGVNKALEVVEEYIYFKEYALTTADYIEREGLFDSLLYELVNHFYHYQNEDLENFDVID